MASAGGTDLHSPHEIGELDIGLQATTTTRSHKVSPPVS
jgi:hypothetical protein